MHRGFSPPTIRLPAVVRTAIMHYMRARTDKLSVSIGRDITAWLRRSAAKRRTSVSYIIREALLPAYERRHAKSIPAASREVAQ